MTSVRPPDTKHPTVAVIGMGYIGLPTAAVLATRGVPVIGVDIQADVVDAVSRGEVPFAEPDLAVAVSGAVAMGNLTASVETPQADVYIIAVPTPFKENHRADLRHVETATRAIAPQLRGGEIVILESTSPPGTTEQIAQWLMEQRPDLRPPGATEFRPDYHVAHCPERVLPGRIMVEMLTNDRVIGGITADCAERAAELYRVFCQGEIAITTARAAEMSKLVENSFRDVNIAFANELALVCERLRINVWDVIALANRHPRVNILQPGPGVGGHCIAVDPWFIVGAAEEEARIIRLARTINDERPHLLAQRIVDRASRFKQPRLAMLGLAYKADVDDLRESPAIEIVELVATQLPDVDIAVCEPHLAELPFELQQRSNVRLSHLVPAIEEADIVALLVDHRPFKTIPPSLLEGRILFDTRGIWTR